MSRRAGVAPLVVVFALLLLVAGVLPLEAQQGGAPSLRPYGHVFVAYAIGWVLVLGWAVSIARRLGRVEERLSRQEDGGAG